MSRLESAALKVLIFLGVVSAVLAALEIDSTDLSLLFGAVAAAFLTLAGLVALAFRMPYLPPLVLPEASLWQTRVRQAYAGDGLARLHILEALEAADTAGTSTPVRRVLDRREEVLGFSRKEFNLLLRDEVARIEIMA
ncbi:MAG: hypothetical protein KGJ23_11765 [Euryarchaeota archaeon]|nr:hypothetical protein [Euryarchaeota archaeon]MDE1837272.1 hypothetical protein [Euryarchaeota archaeon]MDE1879942.1 hypothetical protein [Euryarchaeota archaeon]MDE2045124.1 hypothetical protein [Thermoplasmata archaeon]